MSGTYVMSCGLIVAGQYCSQRAETVVERDDYVRRALPFKESVPIMRRYGRGEVHLPDSI